MDQGALTLGAPTGSYKANFNINQSGYYPVINLKNTSQIQLLILRLVLKELAKVIGCWYCK
jgi:hypothetical protein